MPALMYDIVMPPPIVPAPTTAARRISAAGVSFGTSGTFAASRSAKNRCRSAFDSVETTHFAKSSRSRSDPASKDKVNAPSIASTAASGADAPLAIFFRAARVAWQAATPAAF